MNRHILLFYLVFPSKKLIGAKTMVEESPKSVKIDLNQFKLQIYLKPEVELTLHFEKYELIDHPLQRVSLEQEAKYLKKVDFDLNFTS